MTDMYLKIPGIQGDVTEKSHKGWIAIQSFEFDVEKPLAMLVGRSSNRYSTAPRFSEVSFTKFRDMASPLLLSKVLSNGVLNEVQIDVVTTGKDLSTIESYLFKNVMLSRFRPSQQGIAATEVGQMNYTQLEMSYTARNAQNKLMSPMRTGYNLETAEVC